MRDSSEAALEGGYKSLGGGEGEPAIDYLQLTQRAYKSSTDYMSSNLRRTWERNVYNWMSRHPPGSKYRTSSYQHRSRLFRPKTRASVRNKEAALVMAFFSTSDLMNVRASDQSNPEDVDSAKVMQEIVNLRLKKTIPWLKTVVGAFQDANVIGTVVSHQYWDYEERVTPGGQRVVGEKYDSLAGNMKQYEQVEDKVEIISDKPVIELVENENFRIDPAANWIDPIGSTPYIIHMLPMYIVDVLDRMQRTDSKTGQPEWKSLTVQQILKARSIGEHDSTRQAREQDRQDPKDGTSSSVEEHTVVWVFRTIMRMPGEGDMVWYTLGTQELLTDPVPLGKVYLHNRRPYAMGHAVIEAHRNYPSGTGELGQDMQSGGNENMNQRFDGVRQMLNKRYFVRRGATVDLRSLRRNVSGSIVMMGDVDKDVKVPDTPDVVKSSYEEQSLFDNDFDDVTGNFSAGSVQSNRNLGETVGGMKMLKDPSNVNTEYVLKVFASTWAQEVLTQLVQLVQAYETDEVIIQAAGKAARVKKIPKGLMQAPLDMEVDVGFGVTDPQSRITRVLYGTESISKVAPQELQRLKPGELTKEVFGILGYQDGSRFFMTDEEFAKHQEENPPPPSEIQLKIESAERIEAARLQMQQNIEAEKIMSAERIEAAKLSVLVGDTINTQEVEQLGKSVEIEKVNIDAFKAQTDRKKIHFDREDSLRKDAEIRDKEKAKTSRGGGN